MALLLSSCAVSWLLHIAINMIYAIFRLLLAEINACNRCGGLQLVVGRFSGVVVFDLDIWLLIVWLVPPLSSRRVPGTVRVWHLWLSVGFRLILGYLSSYMCSRIVVVILLQCSRSYHVVLFPPEDKGVG